MQVIHTKHTHSREKPSSYFNTTRRHSRLRHAWGAAKTYRRHSPAGKSIPVSYGWMIERAGVSGSLSQNLLRRPERVRSLVNSPDTASWNSSSLRALRGDDPLTTDCSSSWCSVARVCSASERILFFSTSCSNFTLRTWAQPHTYTHKHTHTQTVRDYWLLETQTNIYFLLSSGM